MRKLVLKSGKYLFIFVLMVMINSSCEKIESQIPDVPVSISINLNIYNELTIPGNSLLFPHSGFGGVIVYCEIPGTYYAYDAACTHEVNQTCTLVNEGALGTCSCCGSKYIFAGAAYPTEGPASAPLKQYKVSFVGNSMLRVYN